MAEATRVRIRLLGPVELVTNDAGLGGPKRRLVLAVLALRVGTVVPADTLADIVWAEGTVPADPQRSLQVHVSKLRGALDGVAPDAAITHRGPGYVLEIPPETVDVHHFEDRVEEGIALVRDEPGRARELLAEALGLWRGRALGGLSEHPALRSEVTRLEELRQRALESRIEADLATGRHEEVAGELAELTTRYPLRERRWGQLMLALYRSGRQAEALDAYQRARDTLAEELGADPSDALRSLHEAILRRDGGLDAPPAPKRPEAPATAVVRDDASVAVLPFEVIGGGEDASLLAVGLHNDLLTELSTLPDVTVISRRSVLRYSGRDVPIPEVADELGVGTVVTGTVQTAGARLRLTVQLVDAVRDVHRWAERYDHELTPENLFAIQSDLASEITAGLSRQLSRTGREGPRTVNLDAYRLAAEARQQFDRKTEDGFRRAIELYRDAVDLDPNYADAWVGLADASAAMEAYGHGDRHELLPQSEKAAHRALALDLESAAARVSLGMLDAAHQDGPAALREFERAMRRRPSYADAHNWHSWVSLLVGRAEQSLHSAIRAAELDPLAAESHAHLALAHAAMGDPRPGLEAARRAQRYSTYTTADLYEGLCLHELGRHEEAVEVLGPLATVEPDVFAVPWAAHGPDALLALSLAALDEQDDAEAILTRLDRADARFDAAVVELGIGRIEEADARFGTVNRLGAWPTLVVHHYLSRLWVSSPSHGKLRELAHGSWRVIAPADGLESVR